jgi:hypothetical protein
LTQLETIAAHDAADWFADLGLPVPQLVPTLALKHQIAQKLHACTTPDETAWVNDRAHDLVDLQLAARIYRGSVRQGWPARYSAEANGLDVLANLDAAIAWTNQFITQIDASKGVDRT